MHFFNFEEPSQNVVAVVGEEWTDELDHETTVFYQQVLEAAAERCLHEHVIPMQQRRRDKLRGQVREKWDRDGHEYDIRDVEAEVERLEAGERKTFMSNQQGGFAHAVARVHAAFRIGDMTELESGWKIVVEHALVDPPRKPATLPTNGTPPVLRIVRDDE